MTFSQFQQPDQFRPNQQFQQGQINPYQDQQGRRRFGHLNQDNQNNQDNDPNNNIFTRFGLSALSNMFNLGVPSSLLSGLGQGGNNQNRYNNRFDSPMFSNNNPYDM